MPHSIDAERAVLGAILLDPPCLERVTPLIAEADFYIKPHRLLWRGVVTLSERGTPCDAVTVAEWFESQGLAGLVPTQTILAMANETPSSANVTAYAAIVRQRALRRATIEIADKLSRRAFDDREDARLMIDDGVRDLMLLEQVSTKHEWTVAQATKLAVAELMTAAANPGKLVGVPSGLVSFDAMLGGFHPGDFIVLAGRPAMGKTALLFGCAYNAACAGFAPGIISGEQPAQQLGLRWLSLASNVSAARMRVGQVYEEEWPRVVAGGSDLKKLPGIILDRSAPRVSEVKRAARRWKKEHNIAGLYIDYLQRLQGEHEDSDARRSEIVGESARSLKDLARELEIPVIALAQVKRSVEERPDKRPRMGDICDSSEIEKEADVVATIYRDEYYNADSPDKGVAEILIDKNRHGPTGYTKVAWRAEVMRYADLSQDHYLGDYNDAR